MSATADTPGDILAFGVLLSPPPLFRSQRMFGSVLPTFKAKQRSLVGYSPRRCKESDTTEGVSTHAFLWGLPRWR